MRLPPGIQLVELQLWLSAFFVIMFCFCYLAAFSAPASLLANALAGPVFGTVDGQFWQLVGIASAGAIESVDDDEDSTAPFVAGGASLND